MSARRQPPAGLRIAILTPTLAGQGAERKALSIASGLIGRGYEVDLLLERLVCHYPDETPGAARLFFTSGRGDDRTRANLRRMAAAPRPLVPAPLPWRVRYPRLALAAKLDGRQRPLLASTRLPRWAAGVAAYLESERPGGVLAMNVLSAAAATMALRLARHRPARVVATLHDVLRNRRLRRRAHRAYPYADAAVGVSHGVAAQFAAIPGLEPGRVHTIYNPVVPADLDKRAGAPVEHPWLRGEAAGGCPVILAVGRLRRVKDFPNLLAAFARLLARRRPARLIVLGQGSLRPRLLSLARELGVAEHVDFPGFVENPYAFLARASLFVLSSRHEALPTVLIEAMACGCPVVSTNCPFGPREVLEGGRFGELVPVGDPDALAGAMERALDAPPRPDALRERAAFFGIERAVDRYEELLAGGA